MRLFKSGYTNDAGSQQGGGGGKGACGRDLLDSTWVNGSFGDEYNIYGFPLLGNEGVTEYCVGSKGGGKRGSEGGGARVGGRGRTYKIRINVSDVSEPYTHKVTVCTTVPRSVMLRNLDRRFKLVEGLARHLLDAEVNEVKVSWGKNPELGPELVPKLVEYECCLMYFCLTREYMAICKRK